VAEDDKGLSGLERRRLRLLVDRETRRRLLDARVSQRGRHGQFRRLSVDSPLRSGAVDTPWGVLEFPEGAENRGDTRAEAVRA
jgi:hypothetical protein